MNYIFTLFLVFILLILFSFLFNFNSFYTINYLPIKFYIISLKNTSSDRKLNSQKIAKKLPNVTIVEAINGSELTKQDLEQFVLDGYLLPPFEDEYVTGRSIMVNQFACLLSHKKALDLASKELKTNECAIIIEDDVDILDNFLKVVKEIKLRFDSSGDDIINLFVNDHDSSVRNNKRDILVPTPKGLWGTVCYMTKAGSFRHNLIPMRGALDEQLTNMSGLKSKTYIDSPIIKLLDIPSHIIGQPRTIYSVLSENF